MFPLGVTNKRVLLFAIALPISIKIDAVVMMLITLLSSGFSALSIGAIIPFLQSLTSGISVDDGSLFNVFLIQSSLSLQQYTTLIFFLALTLNLFFRIYVNGKWQILTQSFRFSWLIKYIQISCIRIIVSLERYQHLS